jgi:hypothetical protein
MKTVIHKELEWSLEVPETRFTFAEAEEYAKSLGSGWRLPTRTELMDIVDKSRTNPSINGEIFPSTPAGLYWTSTVWEGNINYRWDVYFLDGSIYGRHIDQKDRVRLVRSK